MVVETATQCRGVVRTYSASGRPLLFGPSQTRNMPTAKSKLRPRLIAAAILLWAAAGGAQQIHRVYLSFLHLPSAGFTDAWCDDVAGAILFPVIAAACIVWLKRHWKLSTTRPPLWRERRELRFVLYCFAILQLAQPLLAVFAAAVWAACNPCSPSWRTIFWQNFHAFRLVYPAVGIAIILYDRRRLLRDRKDAGECLNCGYDLRATPDRCPECGTIPPNHPLSPSHPHA